MREEFVACRSDGHHWLASNTEVLSTRRIERDLECHRCGSRRLDEVERRSGMVVRRRYRMQKGYRLYGSGRHPRQEFRLALITVELGADAA